jgi:uncharacterized protein DUF262
MAQQQFHTRNYSIRDFDEWHERGDLTLAPKFQRRDVWKPKARSYLIDTILRGKPIPKLYMRQSVNPKTRRTTREIVDGQQRLRTVLSFLKDGFKISTAHHEDFGGSTFSDLEPETQGEILKYEFVVDLLQDMPDNEVYDVFARINTYAEKLKPQELRNAQFFGEFKSSVYALAKEAVVFLESNRVFNSKQILRMAEAEFISELLLAIHDGVHEGKKSVIDKAYTDYDDSFPGRKRHERQFRETLDMIGTILGDGLRTLEFRATRFFYPLFCAVYHMSFGLPKLQAPRKRIKATAYPRLKISLEEINELITSIGAAAGTQNPVTLSAEDRKFYEAYREHWVHSSNRTTLTQYLCKKLVAALG